MMTPLGLPLDQTEIQNSIETRAPRKESGEGTLRVLRYKDGCAVTARFPDKVKEEEGPCR